jgi:hypothetical protein
MCAQKLWEGASVNTVAGILHCAKMYSCLELKNKCIDFFALEDNFKKAVLTKGFVKLVTSSLQLLMTYDIGLGYDYLRQRKVLSQIRFR